MPVPNTIVIVDDDHEIRELLATYLSRNGFQLNGQGLLTPARIAVMVLVVLIVLLLSFFTIRSITHPLGRIARAARDFGRDIDHPPLPEHGSEELVATARAFNRMQERIKRYLKDRENLFSAISHDLKTPITRLRLRAELVEDPALQQGLIRNLDELDLMVKGALQSVKDTDIHENTEEVQVQTLLEAIREELALRGKPMTVSGEALPLRAKPLALKRCLTNLIDNAVFYGEGVEVCLADSLQTLTIRIYDHGSGIPEQALETVFEPYVRLERSRNRHTGGNGLGLGIARNIAHAHGGQLTLHNHPSKGLEARLVLPRL